MAEVSNVGQGASGTVLRMLLQPGALCLYSNHEVLALEGWELCGRFDRLRVRVQPVMRYEKKTAHLPQGCRITGFLGFHVTAQFSR